MRLERILYPTRHAPDKLVGLRLPIRIQGGPPRMQELRDQGYRRSEAARLLGVPYTSFLFNEKKYAELDLVDLFPDGHRHRSTSHPHSHAGKIRLGIEEILRGIVKENPEQKVILRKFAWEFGVSTRFVSKVYNNMREFEAAPPLKFAVPQREGTVDFRRKQVITLRNQGMSYQVICDKTGLSLGYVKGILAGRYKIKGEVDL